MYSYAHPDALYLSGARVCTAADIIWMGDLDLTSTDGSRLRQIATRLNLILYVHVSIVRIGEDLTSFPEAIVDADSITLTRSGLSYLGPGMANGEIRITRTRCAE